MLLPYAGRVCEKQRKNCPHQAECTAAAEKAGRGSPAKAAAVRGSYAKARRRAGKPRQSAPLRRTGRNIKKAAGRMTRRLRGLYSSACSKLTSLLLWLYNTVRIWRYCDEAEKLWLQFKTSLVKYTAKRVTKGKNVFITEPRGGILTRNRSRLFPF